MTHLTAAYMAIGLITAPNALKVQDKWGNGQLELLDILTGYASFSRRLDDAAFNCIGCSPGVVQYEVDEEFGAWFGEMVLAHQNGHEPSREACCVQLRMLMYDLFKKACVEGPEGDTLRTELMSVLAAVEFTEES